MSENRNPAGFPIRGVHGGYSSVRIPWAVAERAYATYASRYGHSQSLERLAERGGFSPGEMDSFAPGWREEAGNPDLSSLCCRVAHCDECKPYRAAPARKPVMIDYIFPLTTGDVRLVFNDETGAANTYYPGLHRSGCEPIADDEYHAERLGIAPGRHRLAHELVHHLVGFGLGNAQGSVVIHADAHHLAQPDPAAREEEWFTTAVTYYAFDRLGAADRAGYYFRALEELQARGVDVDALARRARWLLSAPDVLPTGSAVTVKIASPATNDGRFGARTIAAALCPHGESSPAFCRTCSRAAALEAL